jgi:ribosome biogenesis protein SSF1/2
VCFILQTTLLVKRNFTVQKRPHSPGDEFRHSPLVVLNNFTSSDAHKKITTAMVQNMFPAIDVKEIKLGECRRVVIFNYDSANDAIEFRHYFVTASPVGINKSVKRVIKARIPNLHNLRDISDMIYAQGTNYDTSDSEAEDGVDNTIDLPQHMPGRGNRESSKSAIRLRELGPRMTLQLLKIEEEFCAGRVLYHSLVSVTDAFSCTCVLCLC